MTEAIVVSTTAGSNEDAELIADALLKDGLAACVQLFPIQSRYRWQGETVRAAETLLLIKTRAALFEEVALTIRTLSAYETPEIIATSVTNGWLDYLNWVAESTGGVVD